MTKKTSLITLEKYLEDAAPEAYGELTRTWPLGRFRGDAGENSPEFKRFREAQARCRHVLLEAFDEGELEVYGRDRDDPLSRFAVLDLDRQREVLEQWKYDPDGCPPGAVYLPDYGNMPVRVFRRDGQVVGIAETNYEEMLKNCTYEVVVIDAGTKLINEGDKRGPGFPRRVYKRIGSPKKPGFETVRKYVTGLKLG